MLFSGSDLIRMGALQAEMVDRLQRRESSSHKAVQAVDLGGRPHNEDRGGKRQSALAKFALLGLKPKSKPQAAVGYGLTPVYKKGEILDLYA